MGYDATCRGTLGKQSSDGVAQLETDFILFRAEALRFKATFKALTKVEAKGDVLVLEFEGKQARLHLGEKLAAKWAGKILNPPSLFDKLGVKPDTTIYLEGALAIDVQAPAPLTEADLVFLAAPDKSALMQVAELAKCMRPDAGLWIVYPKGRTEVREMDVITAGRAAGLKDVKVTRFSDQETALKFVVPVANRSAR